MIKLLSSCMQLVYSISRCCSKIVIDHSAVVTWNLTAVVVSDVELNHIVHHPFIPCFWDYLAMRVIVILVSHACYSYSDTSFMHALLCALQELCNCAQTHMLSIQMEPILHQDCPHNCQDLLAWLPSSITFHVLSFLDPSKFFLSMYDTMYVCKRFLLYTMYWALCFKRCC